MKKILVVEDNQDIREMAVRQLKRRGYEVVEAEDGEKGVQAAGRQIPDLVLMDLNLPALDGWQAIRRLRSDPKTKGIPIVAITAHTTSGDRDAGYEAGADAFVTKPIDFAKLLERIDSLIGKRGG
jgi:CheY-like chemotaxis protein